MVEAFVADAVGASAAQIPEPTGFGTITGTITVTGRVATDKFVDFNVNKDTNICSKEPNRRVVVNNGGLQWGLLYYCLLYTSPSPRDRQKSRMPSSA